MQVLLEEREHLLLGNRWHPGVVLDAGVVVGDECDAGVVHAELAREVRLGVLRHVDDVPALRAVPTRLGARGKAGTRDHDDRSRVVHPDAGALARLQRVASDDRAVRVGVRHVMGGTRVVERVGATPGAVDELVEDDKVARMYVG